jgi:hypothetical protein
VTVVVACAFDKGGAFMSIDVMILPGRKFEPVPGLFLGHLGLARGDPAAVLIGETPALLELGSREVVAADGVLEPGRSYAFCLAADNTLTLSIGLRTDFAEEEYVEDYGGNLSPQERTTIIEAWRRAGPGLTLSSGGGRAAGELELLAALARSCARALSGWICIESGAFVHPRPGICTPEQLEGVRYRLAEGRS